METKYYTLEEISKNDGKQTDKIWIILKDSVYDVTDYLDEHPGGGDLVTEWAGKDGTKAFQEYGHSNDAHKELKKFKIGEVVEEERKNNKKQKEKAKAQNGVSKTPKVVDATPSEKENRRSCMAIITCGLCGA